MKVILCIAVATSLITGCSFNSMPEEHYGGLSSFSGFLQKCFEDRYIDTRLYADSKVAFSYWVNTWNFDQNKLNSMMAEAYERTYANADVCRQTEGSAYELIASVAQRRGDIQADQQIYNNAMRNINQNKPIICNTVGTLTTCF